MKLTDTSLRELQGIAEELHESARNNDNCILPGEYYAAFLIRLIRVSDMLNASNCNLKDVALFNAVLEVVYAGLALSHAMAREIRHADDCKNLRLQ